ncbi:MAG: DUF3179 domain-containing (seleno)protein [Chloroflexi bacterium]|nr:DUF3179 domain-containing (seleno)protein [Chloroflexota bacterium]
MMRGKAGSILALWLWLFIAAPMMTQDYDASNYRKTMIQMLAAAHDAARGRGLDLDVFDAVAASGDALYAAPLIDIAYFSRSQEVGQRVLGALNALTGERGGWREFFDWAGANDIALPPDYDEFKGLLLAAFVDTEFSRFFRPGVMNSAAINLVEPVWGGVTVDGIPSLVNARQISPKDATDEGYQFSDFCRDSDCSYPAADELVFGLSIDGDSRAYPLRLLNWHEMFNDVIGHAPLYAEPDGAWVCDFRAPTAFDARARSGDEWVFIGGRSAGCPREGWLRHEHIQWLDGGDPLNALPDVADGGEALDAGFAGQVRGAPVMLAYCTLCGAGVLYDVSIPDLAYTDQDGARVEMGDTVLEFGSSGLLMRSNKLMYDRNTDTVWNAITGEPAFGPLATSGLVLDVLPVVVTDWASWLAAHPETSVLSLDTGFRRNYTNGAAYSDYFNSTELMFPSWQQDTALIANKEMVFALRLQGQAKAYPLATIIPRRVINDRVGTTDVVILADATPEREFFEPGGAAVRAYHRQGHSFSAGEDEASLVSGDGRSWRISEEALIASDGERLPRIGGHLAFWFGWFGFYPDTLVYGE